MLIINIYLEFMEMSRMVKSNTKMLYEFIQYTRIYKTLLIIDINDDNQDILQQYKEEHYKQ